MTFEQKPPAANSGCEGAARVEPSSLALVLKMVLLLLADKEVTELCINRPGEAFVETAAGWRKEILRFADFDWCRRFAKLVANSSHQRIDETAPMLSASLPTGERVQIVIPPATTNGCVAITVRKPSERVWSVGELAQQGIFHRTARAALGPDPTERSLIDLFAAREYLAFIRLAVRNRKNILVSGPTGSGKTTFTKALIREIPSQERLIAIEDARELVLDEHPNHVRLFYSKDDQGVSRVTPKQLLDACLRMKPDRILLAELRSDEAFDYLRNVNSGHPGSITSIHAASAALAFEQLVLLVKQNQAGRELARSDIKDLLYAVVDIVVQFGVERNERFIKEIWFEPNASRRDRETTGVGVC